MRRTYRKKSVGYLLPFLIFVGFGVISVLAFQLWSNLQNSYGDVFFYIVSGRARILPYGVSEWESAYSGTKLLTGDSLKTSKDGRIVMQFFNGTQVRLGEDTEVSLVDLNKRSDSEKIVLALEHGKIWLNKVRTEDVKTSLLDVHTSHMVVRDVGTVFEVEQDETEAARVLKGSLKIDLLANEQNKKDVAETVDVGVGQEIDVDSALLKSLQNHENPSVLLAVRDDFRASDWYQWNMNEDVNPTDFAHVAASSPVKGQDAAQTKITDASQTRPAEHLQQQTAAAGQSFIDKSATAQSTQDAAKKQSTDQSAFSVKLEAPVITYPAAGETGTDQTKVVVHGKVGQGTAKIMVSQKVAGKTPGKSEEYTLSKFKAGDSTFAYTLAESYKNYAPGLNVYSFYVLDEKGKRSNPATIRVTYTPNVVTPPAVPTPAATPSAISPSLDASETLTKPVVLSFNGVKSSTVATSVVKVEGEVHGAQKMVVGGFTLQKFVPGSTHWIFYANENGGNLKAGSNEYEAYGIDANGKESEHAKFTITYNKAI